jgi:hypothetical protein
MNSWPALTKWTPEYLQSTIGDRQVPVLVNTSGASNVTENGLVSFRTFVDAVSQHRPSHPWHLALGSISSPPPTSLLPRRVVRLFRRLPTPIFPELAEDVRADLLVDPRTIFETNLWISYNGAVTKLHFDYMDNLIAVVSGRKQLILFDEHQSAFLYPDAFLSTNFNFSRVDLENIDDVRFPNVHRARYWECDVGAGEVLFLPREYWHHVRSAGCCVSVNIWFARMSHYFSRRVLRRVATRLALDCGLIAPRAA